MIGLGLIGLYLTFLSLIGLNKSNSVLFLNKVSILILVAYFLSIYLAPNETVDLIYLDGQFWNSQQKVHLESSLILFSILIQGFEGQLKVNKKPEQSQIYQTNILGIQIMQNSYDWIVTIIGWEIFNFSIYLQVTFNRTNENSIGAALKYFLQSAFSTIFFLLGIVIIYYVTGLIGYDSIRIYIEMLQVSSNNIDQDERQQSIGFQQIATAQLFKLAAAPQHFYAPDLYKNLTNSILAWTLTITKLGVFGFLAILLSQFHGFYFFGDLLIFFGLLSLLVGSIGLIGQYRLKTF